MIKNSVIYTRLNNLNYRLEALIERHREQNKEVWREAEELKERISCLPEIHKNIEDLIKNLNDLREEIRVSREDFRREMRNNASQLNNIEYKLDAQEKEIKKDFIVSDFINYNYHQKIKYLGFV